MIFSDHVIESRVLLVITLIMLSVIVVVIYIQVNKSSMMSDFHVRVSH